MTRMKRAQLRIICLFPAFAAALCLACSDCSKEEVAALYSQIPDAETKNARTDLGEWRYRTVVSDRSHETYGYYHLPARRPDAPTLVLVHGLLLDGRSFLRLAPLSAQFELVAVDLPQDSMYYTGRMAGFVKLLDDFLATLALDQIHLAGVSLGGQIVSYYATAPPSLLRHRAEITRLVLISTDLPKSEANLERMHDRARRALRITGGDEDRILCIVDRIADHRRREGTRDEKAVMALFALKHPTFYKQAIFSYLNLESVPELQAIRAPTLIIHGEKDQIFPVDRAEPLKAAIPGAELTVVPGAGHGMVYIDADRVISAMRPFLGRSVTAGR